MIVKSLDHEPCFYGYNGPHQFPIFSVDIQFEFHSSSASLLNTPGLLSVRPANEIPQREEPMSRIRLVFLTLSPNEPFGPIFSLRTVDVGAVIESLFGLISS